MKSKDDTKKNSLRERSSFLVIHGTPIKVLCMKCRQACQGIKLPDYTMYFCESIHCTNILELRVLADGTQQIHDYASAAREALSKEQAQTLMTPPRKKFTPIVVK